MITSTAKINRLSSSASLIGEVPGDVPVPSGTTFLFSAFSGQTVSYTTGDDGWHFQNGTFDLNLPPYPVAYAELDLSAADPFATLVPDNAFGNKNRFTDDAGGQTYANDCVIDHYTGWMFYRVIPSLATWLNAINTANASNAGGYSGWMVANRKQATSIYKWAAGEANAMNYSPFFTNTGVWWTSTTYQGDSTRAILANHVGGGSISLRDKALTGYYFICRKHYG